MTRHNINVEEKLRAAVPGYRIFNLQSQRQEGSWHVHTVLDPVLEQKYIIAKATLIKRYKYCVKFFVSVVQLKRKKLILNWEEQAAFVKLNRM